MSPSLHAAQLALLSDQTRLPSGARVLLTLAVLVTRWDRYRRTRKALHHLAPHLLKDIGVTPQMARREASKPFWRD